MAVWPSAVGVPRQRAVSTPLRCTSRQDRPLAPSLPPYSIVNGLSYPILREMS